jgi:hypothetical protein
MNCNKCDEKLYKIEGVCTDCDKIRNDLYCIECNTRWGVRSHGLVLLAESLDQSKVFKENQDLKATIRNMMRIGGDQ